MKNSSFKECHWVDIHVGNEKTWIGVCYRAPLNSAQEDEGLIELILKASNKITLVMGILILWKLNGNQTKPVEMRTSFRMYSGLIVHSACLASYKG